MQTTYRGVQYPLSTLGFILSSQTLLQLVDSFTYLVEKAERYY